MDPNTAEDFGHFDLSSEPLFGDTLRRQLGPDLTSSAFSVIVEETFKEPPEPGDLVELLKAKGIPVEFDPSERELGRESPFYARVVHVRIGEAAAIMKFIAGDAFDLEDPDMQALGVESARDYLRLDYVALQAGREGMERIPPLLGSIVESDMAKEPTNGVPRPVAVFAPYIDGIELDVAVERGIITLDQARDRLVELFVELDQWGLVRWDPEPDNFFHLLPDGKLALIDGGSVKPKNEFNEEQLAVMEQTSGGLLTPDMHANRVMEAFA